jgi:hypothetical protein
MIEPNASLALRRRVSQSFAFETLPSEVSAGVPLEVSLSISPEHPSNQLLIELTSNGRVRPSVRGWPDGRNPLAGAQSFRALLPALAPGETVEYRPLLSRAGLVLESLPARTTRGVRAAEALITPAIEAPSMTEPGCQWAQEFLGAATVQLAQPPESFGATPDGLRITFYIVSGEIHGPRLNGKIRGEGGDWMLVRRDGVSIADARLTYEMDDGALLLSRYSGVLDLGADGYARALRNEFDPAPPFVLAPQFITAHPNWLWLNRIQCLAVGHASMKELAARWDLYAIRVVGSRR